MTEISIKIDQWLKLKLRKRQIILKRQSNVVKKKFEKKTKNQFVCWIFNRGNKFGTICDLGVTQIPKGLVPQKPKTNYKKSILFQKISFQ
jgi:hypothetical protein